MERNLRPGSANLWSRLSEPSRRTVVGFSARSAFGFALLAISTEPAAAVHAYATMNVVMSGVFAILLRHPINGPHLNLWDDVLWFSAIGHAAHMLGRAS